MATTTELPATTHNGEPFGTVPLWWSLPIWIAVIAPFPGAALVIALIVLGPSLFMETGVLRSYMATDDNGNLWLVDDDTSTRSAVPIDDDIEVVQHGGSEDPSHDPAAIWTVHHPRARRATGRRRHKNGQAAVIINGPAGRSMQEALRKQLPTLTVTWMPRRASEP